MKSASVIISFLDEYLKRNNRTHLSAIEAATLLERAGLLKDSSQRAGKPLREMLRKGLLPHAYQLAGKHSEWVIPQSCGAPVQKRLLAVAGNAYSAATLQSVGRSSAEFERIRTMYRPEVIKVLLVGESRPANDTFFYVGNSNLLAYTQSVFCRILRREYPSPESFLNFFQKAGYFLDDLCLEPVNNLERIPRRQARMAGISELAGRIKDYSPLAVVCIMKAIEPQVRVAIAQSGVQLDQGFCCVPFPSMGNQPNYQAALENILRRFGYF